MDYLKGTIALGKTVVNAIPGVPGALINVLAGTFEAGKETLITTGAQIAHAASVVKEAGKETLETLREKKDILTNLDNTNKLPAKVGVIEIKSQLIALNNQLGNIIKPIKLSQEKSNTDFNKFVNASASAYKVNTRTLAHYKNNRNSELSHEALLALSVQPVLETHLLGKQLSKFKTALAYVVLLDAFIEVDGIPDFFEKYVDNIELSGITLDDVEFLLSLVISLIMLDLDPANQEYGYKENNITKIPYVFNSFNIIFKHNYLADTILPFTKQKVAQILKNVVKAGSTIYELFFQKTSTSAISDFNKSNFVKEKIIDTLFDTGLYKDKCYDLFNSGELTLSKLLVYFIYELQGTIPGLSMFDLGIYKNIFDTVLNQKVNIISKDNFNKLYSAHADLLRAEADAAKDAAIEKYGAEIAKIKALGTSWRTTTGQSGGGFPLLIPIAASVGYGIYNYIHKYTAKARDIIEETVIKNLAYVNPANLTYDKFNNISKGTNNVIDIIESGKYPFLESLLLYIQLKTDISQHDRLLLFNNFECGAQPQVPPIITPDAVGFSEIANSITGLTNEITENTLQFTTIGDLLTIINIVFKNAFTTYNFMGALKILENCGENKTISHAQTITPITNGIYNYIAGIKGNDKTIRKLFLLFICYANIYMLCTDYFKFINPNAQLGENEKSMIKSISKRITLAIHKTKIDDIKICIYDCINYDGTDNINAITFKIIKYCAYKYMLGKAGQAILSRRMALLSSRIPKMVGGAGSRNNRNESFKSANDTANPQSNARVLPPKPTNTTPEATPKIEPVDIAPEPEPVVPETVPELKPEPVVPEPAAPKPEPVPKKSSSRSKKVSKYIKSTRHKTELTKEDEIAEEAERIKALDTEFINSGCVKISDKGVFYNIFVTELFKYNFGVSSSLLMHNMGSSVKNGIFVCPELENIKSYYNIINDALVTDTSSIKFMVFD